MSDGKQGGIKGFFFPSSLTGLIFRDMVIGNTFFILGLYILIYQSNGGLAHIDSSFTFLYNLFGMIIISAPLQVQMWIFGKNPLRFWKDYEVVTTYTDANGNVRSSSDGGFESGILKFIVAAIIIGVGVVIQGIKLIFLPIRYAVAVRHEGVKPPIYQNGFLILAATVALLIVFPSKIAPIAGMVHEDKHNEKMFNKVVKGESRVNVLNGDYLPSAEIRASIEKTQKIYLASHIKYWMGYGYVIHNGDTNTTTVDIEKDNKLPKNYLAGVYYFKNGVFDSFEDKYKTKRTPNDKNIEAVKTKTPHALFDYFLSAKESDLTGNLRYTIRRDIGWKKALIMHNYGNIVIDDNNWPHPGHISYDLRAYAFASTTATGESVFPFLASVTETFTLKNTNGYDTNFNAKQGDEVMVLSEGRMEYRNVEYKINTEKVDIKNIRPTTLDRRPSEFNREYPFDAIVTEDIRYEVWGSGGEVRSIPAGSTVTITVAYENSTTAEVTYEGKKGFIYWKYLRPAN